MNSAPGHQHHNHHAQPSLVFGQLPPTEYAEATPTNLTVDTSSPPLNYNYGNQQPPTQQALNNGSSGGGSRRGPGSIKWTKEGVSTSAERRLPFVHRFRPVGLPPPVGLVTAASSSGSGSSQQPPQTYSNLGPHISKALSKMSQYETNPVGALQERFQAKGILPNYRVVNFEGMSHNPVFTYQVTIGDNVSIGTGNSKKQAKHNAARAMLDKLDGRHPSSGLPTPVTAATPSAPTTGQADSNVLQQNNGGSSNGNNSMSSNPIGCLQEYCVKYSLPLPIYDLQNTTGQPHQRNFEFIAKVGSILSNGCGTSKKDAKRAAATALLEKLKALGSDVTNAAGQANGNNSSIGAPAEIDEELLKQASNMKIPVLTPKHSKFLSDFYQKLQESGKAKLASLHRHSLRDPKLDCVRLLAELSNEQHFEITYVDIEEKTASGEFQCLVQLSTMPVAVCHGSGPDQSTANNRAARNALEYLKIMTRKSVASEAHPSDPKAENDLQVKAEPRTPRGFAGPKKNGK